MKYSSGSTQFRMITTNLILTPSQIKKKVIFVIHLNTNDANKGNNRCHFHKESCKKNIYDTNFSKVLKDSL